MFGPVSGAHFNPVVSFVDAAFGGLPWRTAAAYLPAQVAGCIAGAVLANLMFAEPAVSFSTRHRITGPHFLAEIVATAGLVLVIFALARTGRTTHAPAAVGAYIGAAYFFTSSTSFANPAITIGRMFSDTFAGIAPSSAPGFIAAQLIGGAVGFALVRLFYPDQTGPTPRPRSSPIKPRSTPTGSGGQRELDVEQVDDERGGSVDGSPVIAETTQSGVEAGIGHRDRVRRPAVWPPRAGGRWRRRGHGGRGRAGCARR